MRISTLPVKLAATISRDLTRIAGRIGQHQRTNVREEWGPGKILNLDPTTGIATEDHFVFIPFPVERYLWVKRIYRPDCERIRAVPMWAGSWLNGNEWRAHISSGQINPKEGDLGALDSWANHDASLGCDVWLPHVLGEWGYARYVKRTYPTSGLDFVCDRPVQFHELEALYAPAVIDYISRISGDIPIDWIGHSMGGQLGYAYLGAHKDERIAALATLGSPGKLTKNATKALALIGRLSRMSGYLGIVERSPSQLANRAFLPATKGAANVLSMFAPSSEFAEILYNSENTNPALVAPFLEKVVERAPPGIVEFFVNMIRTEQFASLPLAGEEARNYGELMGGIKQPVMIIGGGKDNVCPGECVEINVENLQSSSRIALIEEEGAGHVDLVVGESAFSSMVAIDNFFSVVT
ncbi:MAG: alpha/beta fold hydrolase [Candidatus Saganbacteria bacterium]|nr:alpha/beta fold hydrolase [Candidatus Saganbacteria bacterium]